MQSSGVALRRIDIGFAVVLAICFIAIWPFLSRPSLPQETDAELHIFRLYELSSLVRGGELYPRWAPDFYHGYGYPIFNYYAPLAYYLGLGVELLPGLDAVDGVKSVFVLSIVIGAIGTYGFVRDNWGRRAGYAAASLLVYSPYIQYIDPHARGVLAESLSFGLFPLALWAHDRLWKRGGLWSCLAVVVTTAAVILSHNLMALLFFALLCAWDLWQVAIAGTGPRESAERRSKKAATAQLIAALLLGLGLAAFFWLPVLLEREAVNLNTLLGVGDNFDFRTHFLSLGELLSVSKRLDWSATEPAFRFNLGVMQWLVAGASLLLLAWRRKRHGRQALFFAFSMAGLLFLMLPVSTIVWQSVPFLPFFQFPWRLLGPTALMIAFLSGAGVGTLLDGLQSKAKSTRHLEAAVPTVVAALLVVLPMLTGLPLSQVAPWPDFGEVNMLRMSLIEHQGRWLGTTSTADFVPSTVEVIPQRNGAVVRGFYEGSSLDRVNRAKGMIPQGTTVDSETIGPLATRYYVTGGVDFKLRLFIFDFPGWTIQIDGSQVETELGTPEGFIVVPVPAGTHTVEVAFGSTPARTLAVAVSLISMILAGRLAWVCAFRRRDIDSWREVESASCSIAADWPVAAVVIVVSLAHVLILEPLGCLHYESLPYQVEVAQRQLFADFGEQIALIGYDASGAEFSAGDGVDVTLYWQARTPLEINYQVFLHLTDANGVLVAQSDKLNPGEFPTKRWPTDKYVRDVHRLTLPLDLPAGEYTVSTGLWERAEGWRLGVLDEAKSQIGDNYLLFKLLVVSSRAVARH